MLCRPSPACDPVPRKSAHATLNFTRSPKPKLRLRRRVKRRDLRARRRVLRVTASVGELSEAMFWAARRNSVTLLF